MRRTRALGGRGMSEAWMTWLRHNGEEPVAAAIAHADHVVRRNWAEHRRSEYVRWALDVKRHSRAVPDHQAMTCREWREWFL